MTKTAHTPGPWTAKWSKYREGVFIVQAGMPSNRVLAQFDGDGYGPDGQSLADARLIAAAPELLDALKSLIQIIEDAREGDDFDASTCDAGGIIFGDIASEALEESRAAIAKAGSRS